MLKIKIIRMSFHWKFEDMGTNGLKKTKQKHLQLNAKKYHLQFWRLVPKKSFAV